MKSGEQAKKPKELALLEEIAREATFKALQDFEPIPEEWRHNLVLGTLIEPEFRVFELYVPGERPLDAIVISSARVNRKTKQVDVTITNLVRRQRT